MTITAEQTQARRRFIDDCSQRSIGGLARLYCDDFDTGAVASKIIKEIGYYLFGQTPFRRSDHTRSPHDVPRATTDWDGD